MNKFFTILFLLMSSVFISGSFAQTRSVPTDAWVLGFGFTYPRYISINNAVVQSNTLYGGHLSIQRNFSEHVGLRIKAAYNHVEATYNIAPKFGQDVTNNMITGDLDFIYYFIPTEPFSPYLFGGPGINFHEPDNAINPGLDNNSTVDGQFNLGVGLEVRISEDWRFKLEAAYHSVWSSNIDGNTGTGNGLFGGTANDTWANGDIGLVYYFDKGAPSKLGDLYHGIEAVDYAKVEELVRRYQSEPTEVDYNRIEDIVKKYSKPKVAESWTLVGVNFDFNKATLRPEAYPILNNAAEILLTHPDVKVDIVGHTDQIGSDKYNDKLSLERAKAVKKYLIAKGVDASRMNTVGKGKRELLFKERDSVSRFSNRRIEFKVR